MMRIVFLLLKLLPLWALTIIARLVGYFVKLANASIYRSICTNLMMVHPLMDDKKRNKLADKALQNQLASTLYSAKSWVMSPDWSLAQIKKVHHLEIFEQALTHPKGLLVIIPHLGTWELLSTWLNQFGNLTIMYKPVQNPTINALMLQGRQHPNTTLVPTDSTGVRAVFRTLNNGGFSVILPDHVPDKHGGEIVPFFGIPTLTGTLTPKLAHKTDCTLVGLACIKTDNGFEVFCYDLDDRMLSDKDTIVATTALNRAMECMINEHFCHYMWGYRRFKFTPFGENPYLLPFDTLHHQAKEHHLKNNKQDNP